MGRFLGHLDSQADTLGRLRYATASDRPRWPEVSDEQIRERARRIPAMLWPSWTMRLLPQAADAPVGTFRLGCAAFLLLPGAASIKVQTIAPSLLGITGSGGQWRFTYTLRQAVDGAYQHTDLTALVKALADLARALDEHPVPIDYARRRTLFDSGDIRLDPAALRRLTIHLGWQWHTDSERLETLLAWHVRYLLTGRQPAPLRGEDASAARLCTELRGKAPLPLRTFLVREAERILAEHGIDEPPAWEPDRSWLPEAAWPGVDPDHVDQERFNHLAADARSISGLARELGWTDEHVRLYCEVTHNRVPLTISNHRPHSADRERVLDPENFRELYERQGQPLRAIATLA